MNLRSDDTLRNAIMTFAVALPFLLSASVDCPALTGTVYSERALVVGETRINASRWSAVQALSDTIDVDAQGQWTLSAERIVIHRWWEERALVSRDPERTTDLVEIEKFRPGHAEHVFAWANASTRYDHPSASFLATSSRITSRLAGSGEGILNVEASEGDRWTVGDENYTFTPLNGDAPHTMSAWHDVRSGNPVLGTRSPTALRITGDFTLFVWQMAVSVTDAQGNVHTYPSGMQYSNRTTVAYGPTYWDTHVQFVRIHVTNGAFSFAQRQGLLRWTHPIFSLEVDGSAQLDRATGHLESHVRRYEPLEQGVRLAGSTAFTVRPAISQNALLRFDVASDSLPAELEPAWLRPETPPGFRFGDRASLWTATVLAGLTAAASAGSYWIWPGFSARRGWEAQLSQARAALERESFAPASRRAKRVLRFHPNNGDAWFYYCAAQSNLYGPACVASKVRRAWEEMSPRANVGLCLATEFFLLGDARRARWWCERALLEANAHEIVDANPELLATVRQILGQPQAEDPSYA